MQAMVARLPQITNMTVEAILATDFFLPLPQPSAPYETLPFKSGIKITRKPSFSFSFSFYYFDFSGSF